MAPKAVDPDDPILLEALRIVRQQVREDLEQAQQLLQQQLQEGRAHRAQPDAALHDRLKAAEQLAREQEEQLRGLPGPSAAERTATTSW